MTSEDDLPTNTLKDFSQDDSYTDSICSMVTPSYSVRSSKESTKNKHHACAYPNCGKTFKKSSQLKSHVCTHKTNKMFVCDWVFCGKPFSTVEELREHVDIMHTIKGQSYLHRPAFPSNIIEQSPVPTNPSQNTFAPCMNDSDNNNSPWVVTDNMSVNLTIGSKDQADSNTQIKMPKRYPCHMTGCEKAFRKSWHLKAHIRSHTGERPFACQWPMCGKRFTRSDKLYRHMNVHTKGKFFSCPVCDKCFMRNDNLTQHLKTHAKPCDTGGTADDADDFSGKTCITLQ